MNLLLLSGSDHKYGTGKITKEMILYYKSNFNDINLIVITNKHGEINDLCSNLNIKNFVLPYKYYVSPKKNLILYLCKKIYTIIFDYISLFILIHKIDIKSIDLIHTNHQRILFSCLIKKCYNIMHIMSIREMKTYKFLYKNQIDIMNNYVDRFISVSNCVKSNWDQIGINANKNFVIYDGITFHNKKNKKKNYDEHRMIIVGNIEYNKSQFTAVKAVDYLIKNKEVNINLDIYGFNEKSNEYYVLIRDYIFEHNLQKYIKIYGFCKNLNHVYDNYTIGLICSKFEGFGLAAVEFMSKGICVVGADRPATNEIIKNYYSGLLFEYNNHIDLANKIMLLLNNRKLMMKLSYNAVNYAYSNFNSINTFKNYYNLYINIINQ